MTIEEYSADHGLSMEQYTGLEFCREWKCCRDPRSPDLASYSILISKGQYLLVGT